MSFLFDVASVNQYWLKN